MATVSRPRRSAAVSERSPRSPDHPDCLSHGGSRPCPGPTRCRSSRGRSGRTTEATDNSGAGAVRRGARLAGRRWLGQGCQQGPDLPVGVASVAAQGAEVGQHALLRPAADRLWGHLEELGDLRGAQVLGLGRLGQRALPFLRSFPGLGTTLCLSGADAIERSTQAGHLAMQPGAAWLPGRCHAWTLTSLSLLALELRSPPTAVAPAQATGMYSHRRAGRHGRMSGCDKQGRSRYCAPGRGACSASNPQVELVPLPPAPASGRRWSIPPRRWREGQEHDGWNREMVQRRQGLRLHRP
jgi:hypothetical protein